MCRCSRRRSRTLSVVAKGISLSAHALSPATTSRSSDENHINVATLRASRRIRSPWIPEKKRVLLRCRSGARGVDLAQSPSHASFQFMNRGEAMAFAGVIVTLLGFLLAAGSVGIATANSVRLVIVLAGIALSLGGILGLIN